MERSLRLPALLGALGGAFLAIVGILALSPFLVGRVGVILVDEQPVAALQMGTTFFVGLSVVFSALFGAVTAFVARTAVPVLRPELQVKEGPVPALVMGAVLGAVLGTLAAFVGVAVVGEQTDTAFLIPFVPGMLLVTVGGAIFGAGTAAAFYLLSEPVLEGEEAEEVRVVRGRLFSAVAIPLVSLAGVVVVAVGLGMLFLRFHVAAPVLGLVVAGGVLAFASLIASRPRRTVPVAEVLLALAGVGVVVVVIAAVMLVAGSGEQAEEPETEPPAVVEESS